MTESPAEVEARLCTVLRESEFHVLQGTWNFQEFTAEQFSATIRQDALALIRDDERWSQLVCCSSEHADAMKVWSFHFAQGINNSGFVGWLASRIKAETGSGVAVVCGQNSLRGGIFDYWCAPVEAGEQILTLLRTLRGDAAA